VLAPVPPPAAAVIERYAAEVGAPMVHVRVTDDVTLPVLGIFQRVNAATATTVLEQLGAGLQPNRDEIARGFAALAMPGRMELISGKPAVLFDVAHNVEKATSLVASLRERFAGRRIHYVVAVGESKDARHILEILAELPSTFTFTSFSTAGRRAIPPAQLAAAAESFGSWGRVIGDPIEALTVTRRISEIDDLVVVTGSTFVVAELRQWYAPTPV
jgi:dihydrofolate synthase/folylpolyglutamate synthase